MGKNCTYATIEESTIYPTAEQALACLHVCQMLSNCCRDIQSHSRGSNQGKSQNKQQKRKRRERVLN
jgi:hypothetical protein